MIVVIGQPRTGTSLAMQMLYAAGADCIGPWPLFEVPFEEWSARNFEACRPTSAAKYVWHKRPAKAFPRDTVFIVTKRNPKVQVESERKFLRFFMPRIPATMHRDERRRRVRAYFEDQHQIRQLVGDRPHVTIAFEDALLMPAITAQKICALVGFGEWVKVASVVEPRDPGNYPGMMEAGLIQRRKSDD